MMFPKPERKQKEKRGLQQRGKRPKKELSELKKPLFAQYERKPSKADRAEFSREVIAAAIERSGGRCQRCRVNPCTTTHHTVGRGRGGRGVLSNAFRACGVCHIEIESDDELKQEIITQYRELYGERFYFDEQDWEEYNRKQAEAQAEEEAQRQRREQLEPIISLLNESLGRRLRAREQRFIDGLNEQQRTMFAGLLRDMMGTYVPDPTFGYGHFND
jgi:hypothetical protein